ncbi:RGS domain-containing protein [Plasmodiophora brassicae]
MGRRGAAVVCSGGAVVALLVGYVARIAPVWLSVAALAVAWASVAAVMTLAFVRRRYPPLAQGCLPLISCCVLANMLSVASDVLYYSGVVSDVVQCNHLERWAVNVISLATVAPYLVMAWRLYVIFEAGEPQLGPVSAWLYLITDMGLVRLFLVSLVLPVSFTLLQTAVPFIRYATAGLYYSCTLRLSRETLLLLFAGNATFLFVLAYLLAAVQRSCSTFGIRHHLWTVALSQAVFVAAYALPITLPAADLVDPSAYIAIARCIVCFVASVALPLYQSYQRSPCVPVLPRPERALSLQGILSDPMYFSFFSEFVSTDDDSRLLEFFVQAKLFPEEANDAGRRRCAHRIFDLYLDKRSARNLSKDVDLEAPEIHHIKQLIDGAAPLPGDLFSKPLSDVFHQMEHFTLRRFRLSDSYRAMRQAMQRHLLIRERLLVSNMADGVYPRLTSPLLSPEHGTPP